MKNCVIVVLSLWVVTCNFGHADSGLTLNGVNCGQKVCKRGDYCSEFDRTCRPCAGICDSSTHNFDATLCMKDCQDYIHDERYLQKDEGGNGNANLRATVQRLSNMVTVVLTLVCFMLAVLAAVLCLQLYKWKQKKNITINSIKNKYFSKKSDSNANKNSLPPDQGNGKPDLRLEMPPPSSQSDHSPMTTTTSISRRPAEDNALDYAYDNPAMATSPTTKQSTESGF